MINNIVHSLLSSICITIPEFFFMVVITLKFMKRNDMLDLYNIGENLKFILIIVIPPAILLDVLNYIIKSPSIINSIASLIIVYILLFQICKITSNKRQLIYPNLKIKSFIYLFLSIVIAFTIEIIPLPIIFKLTNMTFEQIKINFYLILICSISSRILNISILTFLFLDKNKKFQINLTEYIFKNNFFKSLTVIVLLGLVIFESYFVKLILHNNLLNIINTVYEQLLLVISCTFLIPGFMILLIYFCLNYCVLVMNIEK